MNGIFIVVGGMLMNKKILIIGISTFIILILALTVVLVKINKNKQNTDKITIIYIENEEEKQIELTEKNDIKIVNNYLKTIKEEEPIDSKLALVNEIVIKLDSKEEIIIQTSVEKYCYFKDTNIKKLVRMPDGLLDFVKNKTNIK